MTRKAVHHAVNPMSNHKRGFILLPNEPERDLAIAVLMSSMQYVAKHGVVGKSVEKQSIGVRKELLFISSGDPNLDTPEAYHEMSNLMWLFNKPLQEILTCLLEARQKDPKLSVFLGMDTRKIRVGDTNHELHTSHTNTQD